MGIHIRKILYLAAGAGVFYFVPLLPLFFIVSVLAVLQGEWESIDLVLLSLVGLIGLISGVVTWWQLPVIRGQSKTLLILLTLGILMGCITIVIAILFFGNFPLSSSPIGSWNFIMAFYVWFMPILVGLVMIIELWKR